MRETLLSTSRNRRILRARRNRIIIFMREVTALKSSLCMAKSLFTDEYTSKEQDARLMQRIEKLVGAGAPKVSPSATEVFNNCWTFGSRELKVATPRRGRHFKVSLVRDPRHRRAKRHIYSKCLPSTLDDYNVSRLSVSLDIHPPCLSAIAFV